ncbi:MAG: AAA domain-containing protein [Myxococcota bacterium]|jgi:hypothetical protein|nr:AAA domain-containing protein [Myxococcota bacterium]
MSPNQPRIEALRGRLINADIRSRSLRLLRCTQKGAFDCLRLQAHAPREFTTLVKTLGESSNRALPLVDLVNVQPELSAIQNELAELSRAARERWLESGAQELAVGWPFIEGAAADGTYLRAPLLLYPVDLNTSQSGRLRWELRFLGAPDLNESLLRALRRSEGVQLDLETLGHFDEDGKFKPDPETFSAIQRMCSSSGLRLEDSPAFGFEPLATRTRAERDAAPKARFQLRQHLILGRFPRSSSAILGDYEALLEGATRSAILDAVLSVDESADWNAAVAPAPGVDAMASQSGAARLRDWQVLPSDASQDLVFDYVDGLQAGALVVQGPPGTGKSQLIANLLAAYLAEGRSALLVCSKRAALDVVHRRLQVLGLDDAVALVHDVQRDRNALCASLESSIDAFTKVTHAEQDPRAEASPHRLAFGRLRARIDISDAAFARLRTADQGRPSLVELQEALLGVQLSALPDLRAFSSSVELATLDAALPRFDVLWPEFAPYVRPHPLVERSDWAADSAATLQARFLALRQLREQVETLRRSLQPCVHADEPTAPPPRLGARRALEHLGLWDQHSELFALLDSSALALQHDFALFWMWCGGERSSGQWAKVMKKLRKALQTLADVPTPLVLKNRTELVHWQKQLAELVTLRTKWYRFFKPRYWRLRKLPATILAECGELSSTLPVDVDAMCKTARQWQQLIAAMPTDNAFFSFGFRGRRQDLVYAIETLEQHHGLLTAVHALHATLAEQAQAYARLPELDGALELRQTPFFEALWKDVHAARTLQRLREKLDQLAPAFDAKTIENWWNLLLDERFDSLLERLDALLGVADAAPAVARLDRIAQDLPEWGRWLLRWPIIENTRPSQWARWAMYRAWELERLQGDEPLAVEAPLTSDLQLSVLAREYEECMSLAKEGVALRHRQRLSRACRGPGGAAQLKAFRRLAAESRKRRNRKSLRQLIEEYWGQGLPLLRPLWFCSPEAVSALFPPRAQLFDLVIFDEASQCPVESAVPALMRAQRAVIAGDEQQMPPSHFFEASADDADEDESELLASASVLALARLAFASTTLRWHYRSRHEELVAFSNTAFYGNRLVTAPRAARHLRAEFEGLHFERVDGLWQEQCNQAEAERVVELLAMLWSLPEPPSVGVVSFNRKQSELIAARIQQRILVDEGFRAAHEASEKREPIDRLFVRNLENVQGDERDVIIFSMAYGPSQRGGITHARFGPLAMEGGEKRLNVAITRARLGIWLLASFEPEELRVDGSKHPGPKLLKQYLRFVRDFSAGQGAEAVLAEAAQLGNSDSSSDTLMRRQQRRLGLRLREELEQALKARGVHVRGGLGLGGERIDLAVDADDTEGLGLDCGEFLMTADTLARDVYAQQFWARSGWSILRVTPAQWRERREELLEQILNRFQ